MVLKVFSYLTVILYGWPFLCPNSVCCQSFDSEEDGFAFVIGYTVDIPRSGPLFA